MVDSCHLNSSKCLNNGKCVVNIQLNTTSCHCDLCHKGTLCETYIAQQTEFDTTYIFFIIHILQFCLSTLNNGLILELFIRCRRIRNTNCGIYLMAYSIFSFVSSILLVVHRAMHYYPNHIINTNQEKVFNCYINKIGYNALTSLCRLLSSCIAIERGLIIYFERKMHASRWQSYASLILLFGIIVSSVIPMFVYKCQWNAVPNLLFVREFLSWFPILLSVTVYLLATLLVLISFARRIRRYGMEGGSCIKTFLKLVYTHLFIFVPPIAYFISEIPSTIIDLTKNPEHHYYHCGISTGKYVLRVLTAVLPMITIVVTWLLFVYPSRVYMTEFYLNTWSGQWLAKILLLSKSYNDRKQSNRISTYYEHHNRQLTV